MRIATCFLTALLLVCFASGAGADEKKPWVEPQAGTRQLLDCTGAIPINCGDIVTGDNTNAPNNVEAYSCVGWTESGGEVVYELTFTSGPAPSGCKSVTATISNMTADLDVFILGSCDEDDCIAYGNTTATTDCFPEGTHTVYIVVDGYFGALSPFTLEVTCGDCDCPVEPCCPFDNVCAIYDFNESAHGWFPLACGGGPTWEWGPDPTIPTTACDGVAVTNVLGTTLGANYPVNAGEIAVLGPIALGTDCDCMELCHYFDTETSWDGGNVKISTDGGATWNLLNPARGYDGNTNSSPNCIPSEPAFTGHGQASAFVRDCFDISAYNGQEVWIGFFFGSDSSVTYPGWYIKWAKFGSQEPISVEDTSWGKVKGLYR